ncbi:Nop domain-containing protein, partial [Aureobasidium melanogenum]
TNAATTDLSDVLPEEIEGAVKAAAEVSMGTEITEEDLDNIQALAEQVVGFTEYRQQLSSYLTARMQAIAPNLTALVGELVGARLIAHSGSLLNLAKSPASTIQILGAEKALFRALKTKHDTPKYGLIYHASLIGQATGKNKGKIARMLATKAALGLRVDALSDWGTSGEGDKPEPTEEEKMAVGVQGRLLVERRLRGLEGKPIRSTATGVAPNGQAQPAKWEVKEARKYNADADGISANAPAANEDAEMEDVTEAGAEASSDEEEMTKEQKKAAKAAKKAAKEAKKAEKEAKKASEKSSKKRKADDDEDKTEKKKKKKSKD